MSTLHIDAPAAGGAVALEHLAPERTPLFLTARADARQMRIASRAFLIILVLFVAAAPFARVELMRIDAFVPVYTSARVVIEALTAILLFSLYRIVGARSILLLGCGYLFSVFMAMAHLASFPGLLAHEGAFGRASQTTAWLYFIWHGGFSVVLIAFGLMRSEGPDSVVERSFKEIGWAIAAVGCVGAGIVALAAGVELPDLMIGDRDGPRKFWVAVIAWALNAAALVVVFRRRPTSVLDLWVLMVTGAWLFDTTLAALVNGGRFDLGWYAGRVYGLLAAGFVLAMLLWEYNRLHRQLVQHHVSMRRSSVVQLQVAMTSLSVAQRAAGAGFWDWDIERDRFSWSNELFHLFGLDPTQTRASFDVLQRVVHPDDLADAEARVRDALERGIPLYSRYRIVRGDGATRWVDAHGDVVRDGKGVPVRMTGLCIDVTDRVAADEALRESEGRFRLFVEHAPSALAMMDREMNYVAVSHRWMIDYGLSEAIIGRCHYDVFPEIPDHWKEVHRRALAGEVIRSEEDRFLRLDGSVHWLRWEVRPWHRANGSIGGIVAMSEDISERKLAQDALRESEARIRLLMEQAPDGIFVLDSTGHCVDINQAGAAMFGFERDDIVGKMFREHLQVAPGGRGYDDVWSASQGQSITCEWRFRRHDGDEFIGEAVVRRLPDGGLQGIIRDVTERRRAEAAIRDSEYFYRQTLESIPGMVFTTRPDGHCDYQSQQWVEYTGVPMIVHQGDGWNNLLHPDDRERALADWYSAVEQRGTYDLEYRVRRHDGVYEWFKVIGRPILDAQGSIVRWFGVAVNIEQLKRAEALVDERRREIEAALDAVPAMVYVKDAMRRYTRINPETCKVFGVIAEAVVGQRDEDFLPAELARAAQESDERVLAANTAIKGVEEAWHDAHGGEHWVSTSKSPFHDNEGRIAGLVGVSVDITEHKHAEAQRVQALERQRDVLVREVHHRIKNHLQGVIGLLRYKSAGASEASPRIELAISQIASIAQVYGLQGRSHDTQLRLHELIESAIQGAAAAVDFQCAPQLRDVVLPQADAVPMALVINELITNAIKHLRVPVAEGGVRVTLSKDRGDVRVEISGAPAQLPAGFDYGRRLGLGMGLELVSVLLPERRYALCYRQESDTVVAELRFLTEARLSERGGIEAEARVGARSGAGQSIES